MVDFLVCVKNHISKKKTFQRLQDNFIDTQFRPVFKYRTKHYKLMQIPEMWREKLNTNMIFGENISTNTNIKICSHTKRTFKS